MMKSPSSYSVQKNATSAGCFWGLEFSQRSIFSSALTNICLKEEEDEEEEEAASATVSDPFGTGAVTPALCPVAITMNLNK